MNKYNLKELFEIVENIDILSIEFLTKEHYVHFCGYHKNTDIHTEYTICVHALAYKCKQFAFENGYIISSEIHYNSGCAAIYDKDGRVHIDNKLDVIESNEPEAIFIACIHVLNLIRLKNEQQ